jgi:hypothetical protein
MSAPVSSLHSTAQVVEELHLLQQRINRLVGLAGDFPERMTNCVQVAGTPPQAVTLARSEAERLVKQILERMAIEVPPMLDLCLRKLEEPKVMSRGLVPHEVISLLHAIRVLGNKAAHDVLKIELTSDDVHLVVLALVRVVEWYVAEFERGPKLSLPERVVAIRRTGVPWQSPPLPGHYVRRPVEELRLERDLLREDERPGVVVSAVFGLGGIGKSTLAAAVVQSRGVRERFADGVLWLTLGQNPELLSLLGQWIRDLGDHEFRALDVALDGLQPDVGHEVLWVLRDCLSGEVLLAKSLLSARQQDLAELIGQVRDGLAVPVVGVISDGQHSIRKAVAQALPGVPHQLCHFHYLREAARPLYEADRHAKKELKKRVRGVRPLERSLEGRSDAEAEAARGYCDAVRSALTDDGRPPLEAPGLRLQERLSAVAASLDRVAEKRGCRKNCNG